MERIEKLLDEVITRYGMESEQAINVCTLYEEEDFNEEELVAICNELLK